MLRTALLAAAVLASAAASAQPAWVELETSPYNNYRSEDISFVDAERGWAVDGTGRVHRTSDGGATWGHIANLSGYLRSTAFVSETVGWVGTIGSSRKLYETRDGGTTWADISGRISGGIHGVCSLFAVSDQVVYGAGTWNGPASLIKTVDGGASWTSRSMYPHLDTVVDVYFFDALRGLAVGGTRIGGDLRPRVIETTDGGSTWTARHTVEDIASGWGWKLSFPTPDIGYMSIEKNDNDPNSYILKTTDAGRSWTQLTIPVGTGNMQGVGFLTPEIGWVSGRGASSQTTDGGATWTLLEPGTGLDENVNRFQFLDGVGYASGHKIHRLDAQTVAAETGPAEGGLLSVGPNPARTVLTVRYRPTAGEARVAVFDVLGRQVGAVVDASGGGVVEWAIPASLAPGVYTVRLRTAAGEGTRQVAIVR